MRADRDTLGELLARETLTLTGSSPDEADLEPDAINREKAEAWLR